MNDKKKLIFLLPNFTIGGAGNSILNICKNINYKKYEIFIISLGRNDYKSDFKKININVLELKYKKFIFWMRFYIKNNFNLIFKFSM